MRILQSISIPYKPGTASPPGRSWLSQPKIICNGATIQLVGPADFAVPMVNCRLTVVFPGGKYDETTVGGKLGDLPNGGSIFDICWVPAV